MAVLLDDVSVELNGEDLEAMLESARVMLEPFGRIVVEVHLDDKPLVGKELQDQKKKTVGNAKLSLFSADPLELALTTLKQVRELLEFARTTHTESADLLQKDNPRQAMTKLNQAMDVWHQVPQALIQTAMLTGISHETLEVGGSTINQLGSELVSQLKLLYERVLANDTVGLSDSMAYEWPPILDRWTELTKLLADKIEIKRGQKKNNDSEN